MEGRSSGGMTPQSPPVVPKAQEIAVGAGATVPLDTPTENEESELDSLPGKRLPFFATLAISPKTKLPE